MPIIENTIEIKAKPSDVFDLMADHTRYPEWVEIVDEAELVRGEKIEEGAEYEEISMMGPKKSVSKWRVEEFNPPNRQVHIGELPFGTVILSIKTEPNGDEGTTLHHTVEINAFPWLRPLGWLVERLFLVRKFRKDMVKSLDNFKEIAESNAR